MCSSLKEINRNRTNDTEWIKSGRSSGHAQTFLKLKLYKVLKKSNKKSRGRVFDPVSHPEGQGEIKMCTSPVSARSVFWLAVVFVFFLFSSGVCGCERGVEGVRGHMEDREGVVD